MLQCKTCREQLPIGRLLTVGLLWSAVLIALSVPAEASAQTVKSLEEARAVVTFPEGWNVTPYTIEDVQLADEDMSIRDVFDLQSRHDCSTDSVVASYSATVGDDKDIHLFVVAFLPDKESWGKLSLSEFKGCALKSTNRPLRSVNWDGTRASAEMKNGGEWTQAFLDFRRMRRCHISFGTVLITALAPVSKAKEAQAALQQIETKRLPRDSSDLPEGQVDLRFHLACDRE